MTPDGPFPISTLALDTSTEVLSLCATRGDTWAAMSVDRGLHHSPALIPLAERLLHDLEMTVRDLELVVCSIGPGSFTGIRIGIATALGIGHGRGIPVVGVSPLDALGRSWAAWEGDVFPVIDARRGNIYTARYRGGVKQGEYRDIAPDDLAMLLAGAQSPILAGADAPRIAATVLRGIPELLGQPSVRVADTVDPRALLRLGIQTYTTQGADAASPRPLYLRASEAERVSGR
jgi:tRNA threonylcarbamoyladenosine biosynthesis protein TsaB